MPNSLSVVQLASLLLALLATVIQIIYVRQHSSRWGMIAPWIFLTSHVFLYYVSLAIAIYDLPLHEFVEGLDGPLFFQNWSSAIRLHTLLTIVGITLIQIADER